MARTIEVYADRGAVRPCGWGTMNTGALALNVEKCPKSRNLLVLGLPARASKKRKKVTKKR